MEIGVYEAKARLSELLEIVRGGREVVITKHGRPVAKMVPVRSPRRAERAKLMREILAYARTLKVPRIDLRGAIEEGRD